MILMMEKQSMRPNPQAPKESSFASHNLYAEILMQLVHRNLFLVIFDFSFQRRMFLEPSDYEAFTLKRSMYRKFLLTFEKILLLSFSFTATHFDITKRITNHLRKHFANLISEGTTSH